MMPDDGELELAAAWEQRLKRLDAEIARLETILANLRAKRGNMARGLTAMQTAAGLIEPAGDTSTFALALEYVRSLPPGVPVEVAAMIGYAERHGWVTTARDRSVAMNSARYRLAAKHQALVRIGHGEFRTPGPPDAGAR